MKHYDQYCPVAHALELIGDRWALLVVRELMKGPKRYTDLAANLPGIGTNILASRLKGLEAGAIVAKRRLPPPAASQVYELTEYGRALKPVMRELALWGIRSIGPPNDDDVFAAGWLEDALDTVFAPVASLGTYEFRVGEEVASIVDGEVQAGPSGQPDVLVESDVRGFYFLFVERRWDGVRVEGNRALLERLLQAAAPVAPPAAAAA